MRKSQNLESIRKTGELSVSTTALPITQIVASATGVDAPAYTTTTVVNDNAIDLSNVAANDHVVTADGYKGKIKTIDDGNDTLTVEYWQGPDGKERGNTKPTDGQQFSVQRIIMAKTFGLTADVDNTDVVYVGRHGTTRSADSSDLALQPGQSVGFSDPRGVDTTEIYVLAASGTQSVQWIVGSPSGGGNYAAVVGRSAAWYGTVSWTTMTDADATPDVSASIGHITNNSGATTITDFDGVANGFIIVLAGDDNTTIQNNAAIYLNGGSDLTMKTGDVALFVASGSVWYMQSYSQNSA